MAEARYRYADPLEMDRITEADLLCGAAEGVLVEGSGALRRFLRQPPEHHDDPDGARLFAGFAVQPISYAPAYVASYRGSLIAGHRMSLTRAHHFHVDEALFTPYRERFATELAPREAPLREMATGVFALDAGLAPVRHLPGTTVVLCSAEPYNFGSFLFRVLPKLHAVQRLGLGQAPLLVHAPGESHMHYLAMLGAHPAIVIQQDPTRIYSLDHAIRPALRNAQGFLDDETRQLFGDLRRRYGSPGAGSRLYVSRLGHSRRGGSRRVMRNEAVLIETLRGMGFIIIEPEALSAQQQIEAFSSAALVVGPSGAGMFNTAFCQPGTIVIDIESEPGWIHAHSCLFASCELRYTIFEAQADDDDARPVHRRWAVNIPALCERIASFG